MISKARGGELKGTDDIQTMLLNCLVPGAKIPSGGWMNMESLKKIEEFYGKSLSPKDLESLKKAQELLKGKIPQGTPTPSDKKTLNLEDIKQLQENLKNIPPEDLELMKKMQKQGQFENASPIEAPSGGGSGMGM